MDDITYRLAVYGRLMDMGLISMAMFLGLVKGLARSTGSTVEEITERFNAMGGKYLIGIDVWIDD